MEIILKEDIQNLGYKDDIVKVKDGYGRNFLIPTGKAVIASESAKKVLAEKISGLTITIGAKTSTTGTIFGSVNNIQVAEALEKQGFNIDRKIISIKDTIKEVGQYTATVKLHKEVAPVINIVVVSE